MYFSRRMNVIHANDFLSDDDGGGGGGGVGDVGGDVDVDVMLDDDVVLCLQVFIYRLKGCQWMY